MDHTILTSSGEEEGGFLKEDSECKSPEVGACLAYLRPHGEMSVTGWGGVWKELSRRLRTER